MDKERDSSSSFLIPPSDSSSLLLSTLENSSFPSLYFQLQDFCLVLLHNFSLLIFSESHCHHMGLPSACSPLSLNTFRIAAWKSSSMKKTSQRQFLMPVLFWFSFPVSGSCAPVSCVSCNFLLMTGHFR